MRKPINSLVSERQDPLYKRYLVTPEKAAITDHAKTSGGTSNKPFNGTVYPGGYDYDASLQFGIHRAIGGYHDQPNPGDILCAALAACLDATIRIIANRLGVSINVLEVEVSANADVRGTLVVDRNVQVGFQSMLCEVNLQPAEGTDPKLAKKLLAAAEYSCVNMQTLRAGVPVETKLNIGDTQQVA